MKSIRFPRACCLFSPSNPTKPIHSAAWLLLCGYSVTALAGDLTVGGLRCEYRTDPLAVDAARPRLSWTALSPTRGARQTAYKILIDSSLKTLAADQGDLWDSGKVASDE